MPPAPVKIERISGDRTRQNTFHKRKLGLLKKAIELTVLCDCDIAIIMRSGPTMMCPEGKLSAYCNKDLDAMIADYMTEPPKEHYTNAEYARLAKSNDVPVQFGGSAMPVHLPPMPVSAVQIKSDPDQEMQRTQSNSDAEDAQELKQRLTSLEEELERLRSKVTSSGSISVEAAVAAESEPEATVTEVKVGRKRSPPPLECEEISCSSEPKKQCKASSEPEDRIAIAYGAEGEEPNLSSLIESMEEQNSVAPETLSLGSEISGSVGFLLSREISWSRVGRETSWDLSSLLASTPTHLQASPCSRLVTPSVKLAGCPLLARA